jgi:hypothetical protein
MRITKKLENGEVVAVSANATEDDFQAGIDLGPGVTGRMHLFRHCDEIHRRVMPTLPKGSHQS